MKIVVDDEEILALNETKKNVLKDEISEDIFDYDMKRRLKHIIMHKYELCFLKLKQEWEEKLKQRGLKSIPLDNDQFAELVFSQPDYKSRKQRDICEQ